MPPTAEPKLDPRSPAVAALHAAAPDLLTAVRSLLDLDPEFMFPMRPVHVPPGEWREWCEALKELRFAAAKAATVFPF